MPRQILSYIILAAICLWSASCRNTRSESLEEGQRLTSEAKLLKLVEYDGYTVADVRNPWSDDSTSLLARYILVGSDFKGKLPEGTIVHVPLSNSIVYSSVHTGIIDEIGALGAVGAVADGNYFTSGKMKQLISSGKVKDVGSSLSPSQETIIDIDPGAILLSPFQNQDMGGVDKLGIPIIQLADYMESTPLGRAEWIRFIGRLYGKAQLADSIYKTVEEAYTTMSENVAGVAAKPSVITEQQYGGSWDMPAGQSYMARILADAGADYIWADTKGSGSLKLDPATVFEKGEDADFWLIRSYGPLSADGLAASAPFNSHFKAFKNGNVYVCDTSRIPLFDEFPFHPERILADYIRIFHPGLLSGELRYFSRLGK